MFKILDNSIYFDFVMKALYECLQQLHIECEIVTDIDHNDFYNIYIVCTAHEKHRRLPNRYVVYQMEQLTVDRDDLGPYYIDRLGGAEFILDYSKENIHYLKDNYDLTAYHLPLGFHESMVFDKKNHTKDYLYTFLGALNEKRRKFISNATFIMYKYINRFFVSDSCFGSEYREIISRSKSCLNIHFYEGHTILEVHRILPLIANKVLVLSERSNDAYYDRNLATCVTWINRNNMSNQLFQVRDMSEQEYNRITNERLDYIKTNFQFSEFVKNVKHLFLC